MIIEYDKRPDATIDQKMQSLIDSIMLALNVKAGSEVEKEAKEASTTATLARKSSAEAIRDAYYAMQSSLEAKTAADTASAAATTANTAAHGALTQLDVVENVVGTLNWIAEHGQYNPTTDEHVVSGKTYFVRTGEGTPTDPYVYAAVAEPKDEDIGTYYELALDDAVSNFVATHLSLTDQGLYITLANDSGYKLLLTNTGAEIQNAEGVAVASYSSSAVIGQRDGWHQTLSDSGITFSRGEENFAYITPGKIQTPVLETTDAFYIGRYSIRYGSDDKLVIGRRR